MHTPMHHDGVHGVRHAPACTHPGQTMGWASMAALTRVVGTDVQQYSSHSPAQLGAAHTFEPLSGSAQ